jgi:hypothetical protein
MIPYQLAAPIETRLHGGARQPGTKRGRVAQLIEMVIRFAPGFDQHVFGVFAIVRNPQHLAMNRILVLARGGLEVGRLARSVLEAHVNIISPLNRAICIHHHSRAGERPGFPALSFGWLLLSQASFLESVP